MMEIVAGVLAFMYRRNIESFLSKELVTSIRQHYPPESEADPEGLRAAWAFIQNEVRLCLLYLLPRYSPNLEVFGASGGSVAEWLASELRRRRARVQIGRDAVG